jgi:hypothetical protein
MPHEKGHIDPRFGPLAPTLPPGEYQIQPYVPGALEAAEEREVRTTEFQAWLNNMAAGGPLPGGPWSPPAGTFYGPPPPHGTTVTPETARQLDDAGFFRNPETGQPYYPLSHPQDLGLWGNIFAPIGEAAQEVLGYAELPGEESISMVADIFDPVGRLDRQREAEEKFEAEHGREPFPHELAAIWAEATPLPFGVRGGAYALADPLNIFGAPVAKGVTKGLATKALVGGVPTADSAAVRKLINVLAEATPVREAQEASYKAQRGKRAEAFQDLLHQAEAAGDPPEVAFKKAMGAFKGEFRREEYSSLRSLFSDAEFDELVNLVMHSDEETYAIINNMTAFRALFAGEQVPQPAQLRRLENIFGTDLVDSVVTARTNDTWQTAMDVIGLPRAIVASFDLSAPLRQGRPLAAGNWREFGKSFLEMFKVLGPKGEANTLAVEEAIRGNKYFNLAENSGLFFAERAGVKGTASAAEEAFVSRFASAIPGVRVSERAYTTFLNKFRHDIFYRHAAEMSGHASREDFKALARMINYGTGRGPLPRKMGNDLANMASAVFFAPRFMTSQPAFIIRGGYDIARAKSFNQGVSRAFTKNLVSFWGTGMGFLGIVDLIGRRMRAEGISVMEAPTVEWNPLSSDFAKIKLGNTRLDMWGGYQPLIRYSAQFMTGKKKRLSSGDIVDAPMWDTVLRWAQTKLSPAGAMGRDIVSGENFLGETMEFSWDTLRREAFSRFVPMVAQDLADAFNQANNPVELIKAAPAVFGVGVQTFQTANDLKNHLALRDFGMLFDDKDMLEADRNNITLSREFQEHLTKYQEAQGAQFTTQEEISFGMAAYNTEKVELEDALQASVVAGARGEVLRQAVQTYLAGKAAAYGTVFSPELQLHMREREDDLRAIYQDKYWSVAPEIDPRTGFVDYKLMEEEQLDILREAETLGLNPENIKYRARVANDVVQTLLVQYREDQEALKFWWDLERRVMEEFGLLDSWERWRDSRFSQTIRENDNTVGRDGWTLDTLKEAVSEEKKRMREFFDPRSAHASGADLERMLLRWGYMKPEQALNEITKQEMVAALKQEVSGWGPAPAVAQ